MALEHFKTQVLLLHSQQSTLDALSAGFGERYSVHVATSGAEALSTLGATPIHVIVSAQDLPGMSGLEALREARKRSPDTIGILLAGSDRDDGLEALVDDQEVFQIVRGAISPEALRNLIDTATKRIRLLAISESANDQAADVDEPSGEHIIMETGEHGRAIITETTSSIPVLQPQRNVVSPNAAGREVDVLVLTRDEEFLQTIKASARGLHNVQYANTPSNAEALVREHKVGVLVTDAAMIGSNIEALTERLRATRPRLVAIVAGRRDDGELLMDLINRGQVYRFLLKPVSPGRARLAIEASVKHHLEAADSAFRGKARAARPVPKPAEPARTAPTTARPAIRAKTAPAAPARRATDKLRESGRSVAPAASSGKAAVHAKAKPDASAASSGRGSGGILSRLPAPKLLAAGTAVLLAIGAAGWWLAGTPEATETAAVADTADGAAPSIVETDISVDAASVDPVPAAPSAWRAIVDEARIARDAGELIAPPDSNAVELYVAARDMAPGEPLIASELDAVIEQVIAMAESSLLAERTDDAAAALRMVRLANPTNPRLPFLTAQLDDLALRAQVAAARAAIRENRFEDAATALAAAEQLSGTDTAELGLLAEELATARSQQQVDEVLARANQRLNDNALTSPSNDNARYYYELVLSSDPQNLAAQQGLNAVASKLVLRARNAIDEGRLQDAERHLGNARELDPDSSELTASVQALETARAAEAEALRQAELEAQAAAREAAEAQALAEPALAETGAEGEPAPADATTAADGSAAGKPAESTGVADPLTEDRADPLAGAEAAGAFGFAARPGGSTAAEDGSGTPEKGMTADTGPGSGSAAAAPERATPDYVPISSLTRTNYVVPDYPRAAQRRNITGWVDVSFTVTRQGIVENIGILNSEPGDAFIDAATEAIAQWRFEPPRENGVPVERRVAVRLAFDLE